MQDVYLYLIFIPLCYIVGSINFATLIAAIKNKDIKKLGSGNPGTMNMLRSVGKFWGCLTFVLDCAKGIAFALIGKFVFKDSNLAMHVLGLATVLGHIFSCFSKFKGGKGVATSLGAFAVISPIAFAVAFVLMLAYLAFAKKGFIASLFAISLLVVTNIIKNCLIRENYYYICLVLLVAWLALIFSTHASNFKRLKNNTENSLTLFGSEENDKKENWPMSEQFNRSNFEQNPSKMKKKHNTKDYVANNDSTLCDNDLLSEEDIKQIKEENWKEKHMPKPCKREEKYRQEMCRLENESLSNELSKEDAKKLKKVTKKYNKLYAYRHKNHSSSHSCLKCCAISIVLVFVIGVTAVFGGYKLFGEQYTGLTFFELTDMLSNLYKADESQIITNPFDAKADSDAFFNTLENALLLDTNITIDDILNLVPVGKGGTGSESASVSDILDQAKDPIASENGSLTGNTYLDELLERSKFDFSSLKDFNGGERKWEITDKMIGALLQQVVLNIDKVDLGLNNGEEGIDYAKLIKNNFEIKQCVLTGNKFDEKATTMSLTIKVNIRNLITDIIFNDKNTENDEEKETKFSEDVFKIAMTKTGIVPESIFLTATTTPKLDKAPVLGINAIDNEKLQTLLKTIDTKLTNGVIESNFNKVGSTIFEYFNKISQMIDENGNGIIFANSLDADGNIINSYVEIDILQKALKTMKITNVSTSDFLLMVRHLHTIGLDFDNNEETYFKENGLTNITTKEDYEADRNALFAAFGVDENYYKDIEAKDFTNALQNIPSKINIKKEKDGKALYEYTQDELKHASLFTDKGLAQIMNTLIADKLGDKFTLDICQLDMTETKMDIYARMNIQDMIKNQLTNVPTSLQPFMLSIFPEKIYVKIIVNMDKTQGCDIIFNYTKAGEDGSDEEIMNESDKMLETIALLMQNLNGTSYSKDAIIQKLSDAIYPALDSFATSENAEIQVEFAKGGLQLPTIYDVVAGIINKDSSDKMSAEEIQQTMACYYDYGDPDLIDSYGDIVDNVSTTYLTGATGFINRELTKKFFMKNLANRPITEDNAFDILTNIGANLSETNISDNFNLKDIKENKNSAEFGNLKISALEFAKLISKQITIITDIGFYKNFKLVDMQMNVDTKTLSFTIAALLDSENQSTGANGINLDNFAAKYLVIKADVLLDDNDLADNNGYKTTIKINNAEGEKINTLLKMVTKITGQSSDSFDTEKVTGDIGKSIKDAFDKFTAQGIALIPSNKIEIGDTTTSGFASTNVYELIGKQILNSNYADGDDEKLRSIIYNLNNLPGKLDTTGESSYRPFAEEVVAPFVWKENENGFFDANGKFDANGSELSLSYIDPSDNKLLIFDKFIGQQIKSTEKKDDATHLIKFSIFTNDANNQELYKSYTKDLGMPDFHPDLVRNASANGVMFLHYQMSIAGLGGSGVATKVLPSNIYGGAFIDLAPLTNGADINPLSYIVGLDEDASEFLNKIMNNLSSDSIDFANKIQTLATTALETDIALDIYGSTQTIKIGTLYSQFDLESTSGYTTMQKYCTGLFRCKVQDPTATPETK